MMSSASNQRFALAYVLLVLLPVFALGAVLSVAPHQVAPASIQGGWTFHPKRDRLPQSSCGGAVPSDPARLRIEQSGRNVVLRWEGVPDLVATGTLQGKQLSAQIGRIPGNCAAASPVLMTAHVEIGPEGRRISGSFRPQECDSCDPALFDAVQEDQPSRPEAR